MASRPEEVFSEEPTAQSQNAQKQVEEEISLKTVQENASSHEWNIKAISIEAAPGGFSPFSTE